MQTVKIRDVELGNGVPKIAVALVGETTEQLKRQAAALNSEKIDLIEWRADYFQMIFDPIQRHRAAEAIRKQLPDKPILFTFRTDREGGHSAIDPVAYRELVIEMAQQCIVDSVDAELFSGDEIVCSIIESAHQQNVKVIISSHDFERTPPLETMVKRFRKMQSLGGDITKLAVMPQSSTDVLTLLQVTDLLKRGIADRPFITMSMAGKGIISRMTGELFGSALTFGSAGSPSAPGQIEVEKLADWLNFFHQQLDK